jgi:hypothetical protein
LPLNLYKHLNQKAGIAEARVPALKTFGKFWAEFIDPESNRFVADANVALRQQVFDISNAEIESVIEPNGVLNDRWREPVSFVDVLHADTLPEDRLTCQYQVAM